jgi:hypothetical protein
VGRDPADQGRPDPDDDREPDGSASGAYDTEERGTGAAEHRASR